jgi:hypothetical protein
MTPSDSTAALKNSGDMILGELKQQKWLLIFFGIVLIVLASFNLHKLTEVKSVKTAPPGSPVVVRGGSVEGRAPIPNGSNAGWTSVTTNPPMLQTVAQYDASYLSLAGVVPKGGSIAGQYTASGLTNNWKITLFFRDKNGQDPGDAAKKLFICSDQNCDASGALANNSYIYLVSDKNGDFSPEAQLDGYDIQRYDLRADPNGCQGPNGTGRGTPCNHLVRVKVEPAPTWSDGSTTSVFKCPAGECDVYVGLYP